MGIGALEVLHVCLARGLKRVSQKLRLILIEACRAALTCAQEPCFINDLLGARQCAPTCAGHAQ